MKDDRRNFPADDFDDGDKKNSFGGDFTKEKKWLIIKLLIVIIPGILYWVTSDDNFEKKVSFNLSVDAGVSSKKIDEKAETPPPVVQNSQNNLYLAEQKYNEGYAAKKRKDFYNAVNFFTQAIDLNPNHALAYCFRGYCYSELQNYYQAFEDFDKALQLEPNNARIYNARGGSHFLMKNYSKAIEDYSKSIQLNPNYAEAYSNRGIVYTELMNYDQAISECTRAIQIDPEHADAYVARGAVYARLQNFNQSINDNNMAIQFAEKLSDQMSLGIAHYNRGVCYQALGDNAKAQADLGQAKILGYNGN